jgi:aminopeptidase-like protein
MLEIIDSLLLKNRTIVTADFAECLTFIRKEIPLRIHEYPTGEDFGTWVIPPQWDVKKAVLSDGENVIASYDDHPLFLAPYSCSFTGWLSLPELLTHVRSSPDNPDVYVYEHRLAYDSRRRLNEWLITLPDSLVQELSLPKYFVDIQVDTKPGQMLVGDYTIQGRLDYTFAFLSHLCHIGQANDGLGGLAVSVEVMKRIAREFPEPKNSYQLLIMPETIGSSVYLSANEDRIDSYLGCIFTETPGVRSPLVVARTRRGTTYLDRVLNYVVTNKKLEFSTCEFGGRIGNDELVFDSPGVGIPGAAIERYPFHAYHTSGDDLDQVDEAHLEEMVEINMDVIRVMESDFVPVPKQRVPVYLNRYGLYSDFYDDQAQNGLDKTIINSFWSGLSVFDIAHRLNTPYEQALAFVSQFVEHGLIDTAPLTPEYFRQAIP